MFLKELLTASNLILKVIYLSNNVHQVTGDMHRVRLVSQKVEICSSQNHFLLRIPLSPFPVLFSPSTESPLVSIVSSCPYHALHLPDL